MQKCASFSLRYFLSKKDIPRNGKKNAINGTREANKPSEGTRAWATDGSAPRSTPVTTEKEGPDFSDSFKGDDAVLREGKDFIQKVVPFII